LRDDPVPCKRNRLSSRQRVDDFLVCTLRDEHFRPLYLATLAMALVESLADALYFPPVIEEKKIKILLKLNIAEDFLWAWHCFWT
jgi:hypothetical protein